MTSKGLAEVVRRATVREYGLPPTVGVYRLGGGLSPVFLVRDATQGFVWVARVTPADVRRPTEVCAGLAIVRRLVGRGSPVARCLETLGGRPATLVDLPWGGRGTLALFEYLPGPQPRLGSGSDRMLGSLVAEVHDAMDRLAAEEPAVRAATQSVPALDLAGMVHEPARCVAAVLDAEPTPGDGREVLARAVAALEARLGGLTPEAASWGLIHGDTHHLNVRTARDGRPVLFDFEHLASGWRLYDLATLIWGTFGRGGSPEVWGGILAGYASVRPLRTLEEDMLGAFIAARHLWWLGLNARHRGHRGRTWSGGGFFTAGLAMLDRLVREGC